MISKANPRFVLHDADMSRTTLGRCALVAALTVPAVIAAGPVEAGGNIDAPPGSAQAIAELIQVDPAVGNLALTIRIGTALAGHQNVGATSEARSVDLGFIGDILSREGCSGGDPTIPPGALPESVFANSADPDAAGGRTGGVEGLVTSTARADATPASSAGSELAPLGIPGLAQIEGGRTAATSTADGHRASAVSEIGRLELAGGLVALEGLRWEATTTLLPERSTTSDFSIGRLVVGGVPVALPLTDVLAVVEDAIDPVLSLVGLEISFPRAVQADDGVELTPLTVGVVPGPVRDGILGPILGALQPARSSIDDFLLGLDCANATYLTVLDVLIGAVTGGGYVAVDVGGVTVRSDLVDFTSLLGQTPPPSDTSTTTSAIDTAAGTKPSSSPAPPSPDDPVVTIAPTPTAPVPLADEQAISVIDEGTRGGPLLLVGAAGLLAILGIAEMDRRRMRRAQRDTLSMAD